MQLPSRVYDVLKWVVIIVVPALTTFYVLLDNIFQWGYAEIVASISAGLCACLGAILGISTAEYNRSKE